MKIFLFIALVIFLISCSGTKITDVLNGSFEKTGYDDSSPEGWFASTLPSDEKYAQLKIDDRIAHSGSNSVSIEISNTPHKREMTYNWVRRVDGLKAGNVYELNVWIKTKNIKRSPFVEIQFLSENGNAVIGEFSTMKRFSVIGTKDWQPVNIIFRIPKGTRKALVLAALESTDNGGGIAWFDDVGISSVKK